MRKSLLGYVVSFIIGIIVLALIAFAIVFAVVKAKYDVNIVSTLSSIKKLNQSVDEDKLCPNKCTDEDLVEAHYTMEYGGSSCVWINPNEHTFEKVVYPSYSFIDEYETNNEFYLCLTDKQLGGVIDKLWAEYDGLDIKVGDKSLDVNLMSLKVLRGYNYEFTEFQAVLKVDFGPVKDALSGFPAKNLKKYIPDVVYITTEAKITSTSSTDIYAYTIDLMSLKLNNLSEKKSEEIIDALDSFVKFGDTDELSNNIWTSIMRVMIGVRKDGEEIAGIGAKLGARCWRSVFESVGGIDGNDEKHYIRYYQFAQW